ncbi:MAG: alpha-1,2-fucosyltransferase [Verrucomicrobiales bacterium]
MIRVVMLGRTGNNLFQYALGRVLAEKYGVPLVLDGSWFNAEGWKSVSCLLGLDLPLQIQRRFSYGSRLLRKLAGKHPWEFRGLPVLKERDGHTGFDERFLDAPEDCVLMGYFQSPKYFACMAPQLRKELDLTRLSWAAETRAYATRLREELSIAVHVRRTDFIGRKEFDVCGESYYRRAMEQMRDRCSGARFYVFSDDPRWCREHFIGSDVEVVALVGGVTNPFHDMFLMSCCRHHIIANSSYSWWAAWLARGEGQRVLAPDRWFGGGLDAPMADRLLESWDMVKTEIS